MEKLSKKIEMCLHAYIKFGGMSYFKGVLENLSLHKAYIEPTQKRAKMAKTVTMALRIWRRLVADMAQTCCRYVEDGLRTGRRQVADRRDFAVSKVPRRSLDGIRHHKVL